MKTNYNQINNTSSNESKVITLKPNEKIEFKSNNFSFTFTNTISNENEILEINTKHLELMAHIYLFGKEFFNDNPYNAISSLISGYYMQENYKQIDENLLGLFLKQNNALFTKEYFINKIQKVAQSKSYINFTNKFSSSAQVILKEFSFDLEKLKNNDYDYKFLSLLALDSLEKEAEADYGAQGLISQTVKFFSSQTQATPEDIMIFRGNLIVDLSMGFSKKGFIIECSSPGLKNVLNLTKLSDINPFEALVYSLFFNKDNILILENFIKDFPLDIPISFSKGEAEALPFSYLMGTQIPEDILLILAQSLSDVNAINYSKVQTFDQEGRFQDDWQIKATDSLLMRAINCKKVKLAAELINLGADVNYINDFNSSILDMAIYSPNEEFLKLLLESGSLKITANSIERHMSYQKISEENFIKLVNLIPDINNKGEEKSLNSLLMGAINSKRVKLASKLIKLGADVNSKDQFGNSLIKNLLAQADKKEFLDLFIDSGKLKVKASDFKGYISYKKLSDETLIKLAHLIPDINNNDDDNSSGSLLSEAISSDRVKLSAELIKLGADVNYQDSYGASPLKTAIFNENEEFLDLIIRSGRLKFTVSEFKEYFRDYRLTDDTLIKLAYSISDLNDNTKGDFVNSLLMESIDCKRDKLAYKLIELGADVNYVSTYRGDFFESVLLKAASNSNEKFLEMIIDSDRLEITASDLKNYRYYDNNIADNSLLKILKLVPDINNNDLIDNEGSLLAIAMKQGRFELAKELIKMGADVNYSYLNYGYNRTTWQEAVYTGKEEFLELLVESKKLIITSEEVNGFSFQDNYYPGNKLYERISKKIDFKNDVTKFKGWLEDGEVHNLDSLLNAAKFFFKKNTGFEEENEFCHKENAGIIDSIKEHIATNWFKNLCVGKSLDNEHCYFSEVPEEIRNIIGLEFAADSLAEALGLATDTSSSTEI